MTIVTKRLVGLATGGITKRIGPFEIIGIGPIGEVDGTIERPIGGAGAIGSPGPIGAPGPEQLTVVDFGLVPHTKRMTASVSQAITKRVPLVLPQSGSCWGASWGSSWGESWFQFVTNATLGYTIRVPQAFPSIHPAHVAIGSERPIGLGTAIGGGGPIGAPGPRLDEGQTLGFPATLTRRVVL